MSQSLIEKFDSARAAGELFMKGKTPIEISRELGITRPQAELAIHDWKQLMKQEIEGSVNVKDKVLQVLFEVDEHWRMIVREAWATVEQADQAGSLGTKTQTMKLIHDIEKSRAQAFQSVGAGYDTEVIEEMNRTQKNHELILKILKETKDKFPEAAEYIAKRISEITQEAEVIEVTSE